MVMAINPSMILHELLFWNNGTRKRAPNVIEKSHMKEALIAPVAKSLVLGLGCQKSTIFDSPGLTPYIMVQIINLK